MHYYVLCSCPRTGSTLVAAALRQIGLGDPQEYFNPVGDHYELRHDFLDPSLQEDVERIKAERSVNGVFGIKTHFHQIPAAILEEFPRLFPDARYVFHTRRNVLRQALSWVRATQTGAWDAERAENRPPAFGRSVILRSVVDMVREVENWEQFFARHAIKPLCVLYEDLCDKYEETMARIVGHIVAAPAQPLRKQADATTDEWVRRFMALGFDDSARGERA